MRAKFYVASVLTVTGLAICSDSIAATKGFVPPDSTTFKNTPLRSTYFGSGEGPPAEDLRIFVPLPGEQDLQYSCMGFAFGYGMTTILENAATPRVRAEPYSAAFIYNATKSSGNCRKGVSPDNVKDLLEEYGVPLERDFPYDAANCSKIYDVSAHSFQTRRKLRNIHRINGPGTEDGVVYRVQDAIANQQPVAIGMPTGPRFAEYFDGIYPTDFRVGPFQPSESETVAKAGYHAMVIVGYDRRRKAFRVMNSYGLDWGSSGFLWLDEKFVTRDDVYLWSAELGEKVVAQNDTATAGAGGINSPVLVTASSQPEFGAPPRPGPPTNIPASDPVEPNWRNVEHDEYAKQKAEQALKIAAGLRGTVGRTPSGQTDTGTNYYPVSVWLRLPKDELEKIERVEYHWDVPSFTSPKIPKDGADNAFLVEYSGTGVVNWATLKVSMKDGSELAIDYPFESLWNYGSLDETDLSKIYVQDDRVLVLPCPEGSMRQVSGICLVP